jgi:hypothetical protein
MPSQTLYSAVLSERRLTWLPPIRATVTPTTNALPERQDALRHGDPILAASDRRAPEPFEDQPTWEDAEWQ